MQVPGRLRDKKLAAISEQIMSAPDCLKHSFDDWDEEGDDAMSDENHVMITKITMMMLIKLVNLDYFLEICCVSFLFEAFLLLFLVIALWGVGS